MRTILRESRNTTISALGQLPRLALAWRGPHITRTTRRIRMRKSLAIVAAAALLLAAGMPLAQDMKPAAAKAAVSASPSGPEMNMNDHMAQMDEHMQLMHALHEKLQSATTPEARKILMDKQREEMEGCMAMMSGMKPRGGQMGAMGGAMMAQKGMPADPGAQMAMMQKRMDTMEMMMQTMMDREGMTAAPKK